MVNGIVMVGVSIESQKNPGPKPPMNHCLGPRCLFIPKVNIILERQSGFFVKQARTAVTALSRLQFDGLQSWDFGMLW